MKRTLWAGLAAGLLMNVLGWLGNQLVLGHLWKGTIASVVPLRERTWLNELISLAPDFIYGVVLAWLFVRLADRGASAAVAAAQAAAVVWLVGPFVTYLGVWNTGFVPGNLAVATTALALLVMPPAAWLVWRLTARRAITVPTVA